MKTKVIKISRTDFIDVEFKETAKAIKDGKLVAFPTETVYGLGANALNAVACDAVFEAKGRPHDNPLIVHILHPEEAEKYADTKNEPLFFRLAERFMPGPLTVILPKKPIIPDSVTVGLSTVALRCPNHPVARKLIELSGVPIAAPSANLSGKPSPTTAEHVIEDMTGRIPYIIDSGACDVGLESTVISLKNGVVRLLRPGYVTLEDLREICPKVEVSEAVLNNLKQNEKPESPGMKYRHYAPSAPVTMVKGKDRDVLEFFKIELKKGNGILCFDEDKSLICDGKESDLVISFGSRSDQLAQANGLFDALRRFDSTGVEKIFARHTASDHLGLAISNRLLRACAFDQIEV